MSEPHARKPIAFVVQSFDGGKFDRRYTETIRPGIAAGGASPQRADEILGVQPVIQKIEQAILAADICVAEVSVDNPNVWLELGYALALNKPTVILCDRSLRERLPFDVQHRPVIFYSIESKSGYEELESRVAAEVRNLVKSLKREAQQPILRMGAEDSDELKGYEIATLAALISAWSSSPAGITLWDVERKLGRAGYSDTQLAIGLSKLQQFGYVEQSLETDRDGEEAHRYRVTPEGISWIHAHEDIISTVTPPRARTPAATFDDDEIPF